MIKIEQGTILKLIDSADFNMHDDVKKYLGKVVRVSQILGGSSFRIYDDGQNLIYDISLVERIVSSDEGLEYRWSRFMSNVRELE